MFGKGELVLSARAAGGDQAGAEGIACVCVADVRACAEIAWFQDRVGLAILIYVDLTKAQSIRPTLTF